MWGCLFGTKSPQYHGLNSSSPFGCQFAIHLNNLSFIFSFSFLLRLQPVAFHHGMIVAGAPKMLRCPGLLKKRKKQMKLITRYDLAFKSDLELRGLYRKTFNALVQSTPESAQRRNSLASLENISRAIKFRYSNQWKMDANPNGLHS